jgi:hypothetical protein
MLRTLTCRTDSPIHLWSVHLGLSKIRQDYLIDGGLRSRTGRDTVLRVDDLQNRKAMDGYVFPIVVYLVILLPKLPRFTLTG